jgi:6-phosphofructokinase 1
LSTTWATPSFKLIDHTPGYGSTARYFAPTIRNLNEENNGSSPADPVLVVQAMGRKIGFIPAAARLADPQREMPLLIFMTESKLTLEQLGESVLDYLNRFGRCIVVVSEGLDVGDIGAVRDSFGHVEFGASESSAAQLVTNYLNTLKFPVTGKARYNIPGTEQRHSAIYASTVDLDEAHNVGLKCAQIAREDGNGWMGTILRERATPTACATTRPRSSWWQLRAILPRALDRPEPHRRHGRLPPLRPTPHRRPLAHHPPGGGLQRFTRFEKRFADQKLPAYVPQGYR